jgi:hypothetical protein
MIYKGIGAYFISRSPIAQWSSVFGSGPNDPGSNPGGAIILIIFIYSIVY